MKHKLKPGWTKVKVMKIFKKGNNGTKSLIKDFGCAYRSKDGNKCAAGCFIPDEIYNPNMENIIISNLMSDNKKLCEYMPFGYIGMTEMQSCHDNLKENESTYEAMENFLKEQVE